MQGEWVTGAVTIIGLSTALGCRILLEALPKFGVVDIAGTRSSHSGSIPRGAGISFIPWIFLLLIGQITGLVETSGPVTLTALLMLGMVGLIDDVHSIGAPVRLLTQLVCGAAVVLSAPDIVNGAWLATAVSLFWIVAFINAFNFMDGIDGISVATGVMIGTHLIIVDAQIGFTDGIPLLVLAVGGLLGFSYFNLPTARLFLGDAGSYLIGGSLGVSALLAWRAGAAFTTVFTPFLVYIFDVAVTLAARLTRGKSPFEPHRDHMYQRCTRAGWTHLRTTTAVGILTLASIASVHLPVGLIANAAIVHIGAAAAVATLYAALPLLAKGAARV